jgi:UDPglucose 6-dehydrogenase
MKITIIGSGYVGLVSGVCLSDLGHDVLCLDLNSEKIALLQSGKVPIFEPGLENLINNNVNAGRLKFTTNIEESVSHGLHRFASKLTQGKSGDLFQKKIEIVS